MVDFPVAHVVHDETPDEPVYLPIAQLVHALETAVEYLPAVHGEHVTFVEVYFPAEQLAHEVAPLALYLPAAQSEHSEAMLAEYVAASHDEHVVSPALAEILPPAQLVHVTAPDEAE